MVVIGQSEALNLPKLFSSLPGGEGVEWLYVDSGSEDESIKIATGAGAKVFALKPESVYAAGTGRYVGTLEAKGAWILYLDGDMVLRPEFISFLERLKEELKKEAPKLPLNTVAFCGRTINYFHDKEGVLVRCQDYAVLAKKETGPIDCWGKEARYHGGAVLYKKEVVLLAGNWNPAILQLEEIDLLSRVRFRGGQLRALDLPMVEHNTATLSIKERFALNFCPRFKGKELIGLGQVVAARLKEGGFGAFVCAYPGPFVVLFGLLISLPLLLFSPLAAILLNLAIALYYGFTKKWYFYLVYLGDLLQLWRGLNHYQLFTPRYRRV